MPLSPDSILAVFPHSNLTKICGDPTWPQLRQIQKELHANSASVPSNLGDGRYGLLKLTMTDTAYAIVSTTAVIAPTNPGPQPDPAKITAATSATAITQIHRQHEKDVKFFEEWQATDRLLVKLICEAVDDDYTAAEKNEYTGYTGTTALRLLTHLIDTYANIDEYDLRANQARLDTPFDPNTPIERLYHQVEEAVAFADAGKTPFTDRQKLNAAVSAIAASGVFNDDVKEWRKKPDGDQTWDNFKKFFSKAHSEWKAELKITAGQHFPRANFVHPTLIAPDDDTAHPYTTALSESLANLATATSTDRAAVATLTDTVSKLTSELAATQAKLVTTLLENAELLKRLSNKGRYNNNTGGGSGGRGGTSGGAGGTSGGGPSNDKEISTEPIHYCWTCGYKSNHPSHLCPNPATGHQRRATRRDPQNGSTKNKPTQQ